jgi:3-hydroxyacyl-CoA dehydrogenase/enoyl-CoA hydratase/3-hydroxybutyryl-CoA epimerase
MATATSRTLQLERREDGLALLWFDDPDRSLNVFSTAVLNELGAMLDQAAADAGIKCLVILSRKPASFIAGADVHEFTKITGPEQAMELCAAGQRLFDKLAALRMPTAAVIHGTCLGGGLELALACDYRVVADLPSTQIGFPEVDLGIIPAWGGTQRLPRVVGIERAFHVILRRRRLDAVAAHRWGLADSLVPDQQAALREITRKYPDYLRQGKQPKVGLPLRTWRQRLLEGNPMGRWLLFRGAKRILRRLVPDDMPAPWEALRAIQVGVRHGMAAGLAQECEAAGRLATTAASRNLITLFLLARGGLEGKEAASALANGRAIRRVGIVGAGTMGAGIAQLAAVKGFDVAVQEVNEAALAAGVKKIEGLIRKAVDRGVLSAAEAETKLSRMIKTTSWEGFGDVDLVIEAAIEDLDLKRKIFRELEKRTRRDAILATNTSSLSVTELQKQSQFPARVAGLHFFNPVHKMPLVEVIRAPETAGNIVADLTSWASSLGKTPVTVRDSPGFLVNRILMPYLNEAGILIAEGMPVKHVDHIMRRFGMPMGPLELLDQVGLDVAAHVARAMRPIFANRLQPHPALERMCEWGWLGQKTGKGFYVYRGKSKQVHAEALTRLRAEVAAPSDSSASLLPEQRSIEARERMVCLMANEAAMCLGENLADRAEVIDLAMVLGTGWAFHRGGPLRYADDRGHEDIVKVLDALAQKLGPRFTPCEELRRRARSGDAFYGPQVGTAADASAAS